MPPQPTFTLGIEEEFQVVDPETRELRSHISEMFAEGEKRLKDEIKREMHEAVIEVGTPICTDVEHARREVTRLRREIINLVRESGLRIAASGTHPISHWASVPITSNERYDQIVYDLQMVARANRICDVPMRVDETICIAALFQAITYKLWTLYSRNMGWRLYRRMLLNENKARAARFGIQGKLIDFSRAEEVPYTDLLEELLAFVDDVVDDLGSREAVYYARTIVARGTGADRQLHKYEETNDLRSVVDYIIAETEHGVI